MDLQDQDPEQDSRFQDQDQDQDFQNSVSRRLETKTQVSRTPSLKTDVLLRWHLFVHGPITNLLLEVCNTELVTSVANEAISLLTVMCNR